MYYIGGTRIALESRQKTNLSLINIGNNRYRYKYEGYNSLVYKITDRQNRIGYRKIMVDFRPLDILKGSFYLHGILDPFTKFQPHWNMLTVNPLL